jgi:methyl-accepting chemotaxis protein
MRSAEKMKAITRHVERSTQEQTRGSRQITRAVETISEMVNQLGDAHRTQVENVMRIIARLDALETAARRQIDRVGRMRSDGN